MKRYLIALFILLLLLIAGCSHEEAGIKANDDEIVIAVNREAITEDIYRVDIEYYLDDDLMGGMATGNADQTVYKENPVFRLTAHEFPEGADLDNFSFHIVISFDKGGIDTFSSSGRILSTNISDHFKVEYGKVYRFNITGNFEDGLELEADTSD